MWARKRLLSLFPPVEERQPSKSCTSCSFFKSAMLRLDEFAKSRALSVLASNILAGEKLDPVQKL